MNIGNVLKELRESKGFTQEQLSECLNINRVQYCQYENNYFNIPIKHIITIANYYQISIDYIFQLSDQKSSNTFAPVDKVVSGNRLKEFRKQHHLTQQKLAEVLNTTYSNIAFYEKGRNLIATPFLYAICKKYDISADYLLGRTN